jgi:hypothetical protein
MISVNEVEGGEEEGDELTGRLTGEGNYYRFV